MENISSIGSDYTSYIQDMIRNSAQSGVAMAAISAEQDILDTLLEGTFQIDSDVPEGSTFSLHDKNIEVYIF